MKRCNKANNLSLGNKMPKLLTTAVLVLSLAMVTGCGKTDNTPATPSTDVKVETSVEAESTPEPTLAETVELAETISETETVEKEPATFDEMIEYLNNSGFSGLKIIVRYNDGTVELLNDDDEYILSDESCAILYYSEKAKDIQSTGAFGFAEINDNCSMIAIPFGYSMETTITVTTVEGNVYEITNNYKEGTTQE